MKELEIIEGNLGYCERILKINSSYNGHCGCSLVGENYEIILLNKEKVPVVSIFIREQCPFLGEGRVCNKN